MTHPILKEMSQLRAAVRAEWTTGTRRMTSKQEQKRRRGRDKWEWNGRRWLAPTRVPPADRPIEEQIRYWAYYGFRVQAQTATTAQMVRPKHFSFWWASLWFIFGFGAGIFFYLFYYLAKQDDMVYLEVRPLGLNLA